MVSKEGYQTFSDSTIVNNNDSLISVALKPIKENHIITFRIIEQKDSTTADTPIEDAIVTLKGEQTYTDSMGMASFNIPSGTCGAYKVFKTGFHSLSDSIIFDDNNSLITVVLKPVEKNINITFMIDERHDSRSATTPVEGALISLNNFRATTDSFGIATILVPQNTVGTYEISKSGYKTVIDSSIFDGNDTLLIISIEPQEAQKQRITFQVFDGGISGNQHRALKNAKISFQGQHLLTDTTGTALFKNLSNLSGNYTVNKKGFKKETGHIDEVLSDSVITITMQPKSLKKEFEASVFPNPTRGRLFIRTNKKAHVKIIEIASGKTIHKEETDAFSKVDFTITQKGSYIVKLHTESGQYKHFTIFVK